MALPNLINYGSNTWVVVHEMKQLHEREIRQEYL